MTRAVLLFLLPVALTLALPTATADTFVCQPVPSALVCAWAWTQPTLLGAATCAYTGVVSACMGGGHEEAPGDVRNYAGGGVCTGTGACAGGQAGQYAIGQLFIGGGFVTAAAPEGSVFVQAFGGASGGAPYRNTIVCGSTILTGGTCLFL